MLRLIAPHLRVESVLELGAERLAELGLDALLLDVDCTLKNYLADDVTPDVSAWIEQLRSAGIGMCLVSNGGGKRIRRLAEKLDLPFVAKACKPFPFGTTAALKKMNFPPARTAMVGDQLFADIMAGRLAGLTCILVRPIHPEEEPWFTRLKRPLERRLLDTKRKAESGKRKAEIRNQKSEIRNPYVAIARPDHWFKNVFMVLGVVLACFYHPELVEIGMLVPLGFALAATCLVASSNYVINEILDAPTDRNHPVKRHRPVPSGVVNVKLAYVEWLLLAVVGLAMAWSLNRPFFFSALGLWIMGLVYNVPPVRTKELPYVDVLSESVNNPLRLLLGWFAVSQTAVPPVSLMVSYWMIGAFFMATKRFSEYRAIDRAETAGAYRGSFKYYDEEKLIISMFFYSTAAALLLGVFIIRYHLELILSIPLIAGFFAYYMHVALKKESAAQAPERLYRERGLMAYLVLCVVVFVLLMFVNIQPLYDLFKVEPSQVSPLWEF